MALALVLAAFRGEWQPAQEPAVRPTPLTLAADALIDLPPTRPTAPQPIAPPAPAPPVEVPDAIVEQLVTVTLPALDRPLVVIPDVAPPPIPPSVSPTPIRENEPEEDFVELAEVMPALVDGLAALQEQIRYPELARHVGIEGRVFVRFIVEKDGTVSDVTVVRGIGGGCDEAAAEAIQQARFTPGRQRGRAVRVRIALPITFRLQ